MTAVVPDIDPTRVEHFMHQVVGDLGADSTPVIGLAHEALLREWPPALRWIEQQLPAGVRIEPVAARAGTLSQLTRAFDLNLTALSLLGLLVGGFLIYNTMSFSVIQRRRLLAILRTLHYQAGRYVLAHVLFGGVFMLGAMVMFMLFLGRSSRWLASLFAGIGFGLFIDEVGKFLTQDNNYFFKPAAAVMYLFIVLVYVISAFLVRRRALSDRELVVNSLKMMQEMAADNLDKRIDEMAPGLTHFTGAGLKNLEALISDARRAVSTAEIVFRNIDQNPSRLLFGGAPPQTSPVVRQQQPQQRAVVR